MSVKGTSIDSWICTLSPEFTVAALLSACNRITIHALSALLLKILNLNLLNPELIEVPV